MTTAVRTGVAVVWAVGMVLLTTWSNTDGAVEVAVISTLLAAALIGTWWVLVLPLAPAVLLIAGSLVSANQPDSDGVTGLGWAAYIAVVTALIVLLLAVGVGANRLVSRAWKHRRGRSGGNPSLQS